MKGVSTTRNVFIPSSNASAFLDTPVRHELTNDPILALIEREKRISQGAFRVKLEWQSGASMAAHERASERVCKSL